MLKTIQIKKSMKYQSVRMIMQDHSVQQHLRCNNFFSNFAVALHLLQILGILNQSNNWREDTYWDVKANYIKLNKKRKLLPVFSFFSYTIILMESKLKLDYLAAKASSDP